MAKIMVLVVCVVAVMLAGSAHAVTQQLEWTFDDLATVGTGTWPNAIPDDSPVADTSGNMRDGFVNNTPYSGTSIEPATLVPGLLPSTGDAVHFGADGTAQSIMRHSGTVPDLPVGLFSSGMSMRMILNIDAALPDTGVYLRKEIMQSGTSGAANDRMGLFYDNDNGGNNIFTPYVQGADRYMQVPWPDIEAVTGHSIVGNPTVLTITYDNTNLSLYADGMLVDSDAGASTVITKSSSRIEIGNDASGNNFSFPMTVDEFAIWSGALSPDQVAADAAFPEPGSVALLLLGLGLLLRRRA